MAQPPEYVRQFSFVDHSTHNPTQPQPGVALDGEFNALKTTSDAVRANLALIQRDDGKLANASVGPDQLREDLTLGLNTVENWAPGQTYDANDGVWHEAALYRSLMAHISTADFAADLAAGNWSLIADHSQFVDRSEAAQVAAEAAQGAAEAAETTAVAAAAAAAASEGNAADSEVAAAESAAAAAQSADEAANAVSDVSDKTVTATGATTARALADRAREHVTPQDFGAVGDGVTNDLAAIQAAWNYGAANRVKVRMTAGQYAIEGQLDTSSGLHVEWDNEAWLLPKAWSDTGSIITNVVFGDTAARIQDNITFVNPQIDMSGMPTDGMSNDNAFGFAWGASNVKIFGGTIKHVAFSWSGGGAGGKAINFEQGVNRAIVQGTLADNCGIGFFVQGLDGTHTNDESKRAAQIIFQGVMARNCEAAFAAFGINSDADPDGDAGDQLVLVDGLTFYNCGHAPSRPADDNQKSGVIVLGEAQNVTIRNVKGHNASTYPETDPGYPDDTDLIGNGLTGPIGAVIWGWGRNITVEGVEYHGDCDSLIRVNRARALGDDAGSTGKPQNVFRFDVNGLRHYGAADTVLALDSNAAARVDVADLTGDLENIVTDTLNTGIVDDNLSGYTGIRLEVIDQGTRASIRGAASGIEVSMNAFSDAISHENNVNSSVHSNVVNANRFSGREFTIADDAAASFTPSPDNGVLVISSSTSLLRALVGFRVATGGAQCTLLGPAITNFAVTTGALSGTTGSDLNFTVSAHTDGKIYLENRRGAEVIVTATQIG